MPFQPAPNDAVRIRAVFVPHGQDVPPEMLHGMGDTIRISVEFTEVENGGEAPQGPAPRAPAP